MAVLCDRNFFFSSSLDLAEQCMWCGEWRRNGEPNSEKSRERKRQYFAMKRAEGEAQKVFAKCAHRCCKLFIYFLLSSELFINIFVTIRALVTQCLIPKMGTEKWSFKKIRDRNEQKKRKKTLLTILLVFFSRSSRTCCTVSSRRGGLHHATETRILENLQM